MINDAIYFATTAHAMQTRKGTDIPYILHPLEAGAIATKFPFNENIICAAILHDVVEDTGIPLNVIKEHFGERIAFLVESQSEDKSKSWMERKEHTIRFLCDVPNEEVKMVSICDKLSNIRALYNDYTEIGNQLWERFNEKDPKKHKWYYTSLVKSLSTISKYPVYEEFSRVVTMLFKDIGE